jgi:hypothetical protein
MEYKIVGSGYCDQLEIKVNEYIQKGYEPLGGVDISPSYEFFQAMIRRVENQKDEDEKKSDNNEDLTTQIINILKKKPCSAIEIAKQLYIQKAIVNNILYKELNGKVKNISTSNPPVWCLV